MNLAVAIVLIAVLAQLPATAPVRHTESVPHDPDDPAIWIHPTDPSKSLIFGTDKMPGNGGLYVFQLNGRIAHAFVPLDRPNNVDVGYGFTVGDRRVDIAVVTERLKHRLRVFAISADGGGSATDLAPQGVPILADATGTAAEPMGIALYERPRDGAVFAIVSPKSGGATNYLAQYRLTYQAGTVVATLVRRVGSFSGIGPEPGAAGEIEAVAVDDALGFVYYADERYGIRKWLADPDAPGADQELAVLGRTGYQGDRDGLPSTAHPMAAAIWSPAIKCPARPA